MQYFMLAEDVQVRLTCIGFPKVPPPKLEEQERVSSVVDPEEFPPEDEEFVEELPEEVVVGEFPTLLKATIPEVLCEELPKEDLALPEELLLFPELTPEEETLLEGLLS